MIGDLDKNTFYAVSKSLIGLDLGGRGSGLETVGEVNSFKEIYL